MHVETTLRIWRRNERLEMLMFPKISTIGSRAILLRLRPQKVLRTPLPIVARDFEALAVPLDLRFSNCSNFGVANDKINLVYRCDTVAVSFYE